MELRIFGLIPIRLSNKKIKKKDTPTAAKREKEKKESRWGFNVKRLLSYLWEGTWQRRAGRALYRLSKRLFFTFKIRVTEGHALYGAENPADTAVRIGRFYALRYSFYFLDLGDRFILDGYFNGKKMECDVQGRVRVYPVRILYALVLFVLEWPLYRTFRLFRR